MYAVLKHWEDDTTELEIKIITNYIWTSSYPMPNLVSDVKQKLLSLPVHPNSLPVCSGVRVARSLVFCVFFCRLFCLSFFELQLLIIPFSGVRVARSLVFCVFCRLFCLSFFELQLLIIPFSGVRVARSLVFCVLQIVLFVLLRITASDYTFQWRSCCSIFSFLCNGLQINVCNFVIFLLTIVLFVLLRITASDNSLASSNFCSQKMTLRTNILTAPTYGVDLYFYHTIFQAVFPTRISLIGGD